MATKFEEKKIPELDCCPDLVKMPTCDTLNFRYRLPFRVTVIGKNKQQQVVPVEVVFIFTLERCSGPLVLGDLIYSTTLLPGEEVRLFTSDRHTRWSYDTESNLAYRHQTTSEESFFTASMAQSMSDLTINESARGRASSEDSWANGGGGASFNLFGLSIGGGGGGGYYDSESAYALCRSLTSHAEQSSRFAAASVRAKSSTSIGEVQKRTHTETESEAQYESSSRLFKNRNKCSATTFLFYKINKVQTVRFKLTAVERRVVDLTTPTGAYPNAPSDIDDGVSVIPQAIPATSKNRLEVERMARTSALERLKYFESTAVKSDPDTKANIARLALANVTTAYEPIPKETRQAALNEVDKDLAAKGFINVKDKTLSENFITRSSLSWEKQEILPTPGIIVKGCLDKCNVCEPALQKEIEYDLETKRLQNELLKKQIELLEKSQEYRCCPGEINSEEDTEE